MFSYISTGNYNYGFSCQIMNSNIYNDILVCFCAHSYPVELASFWVSINSDLEIIDNSFNFVSFESYLNILNRWLLLINLKL